ncbi:hypothetical protein GGF49_006252, partial [Coemansia sp. RSA 1853]
MSTIPTLIVAPAIVAAGVAYKYAGGSDRYGGTRLQDRQEYYVKGGASGRRGSTGSLEHQSGIDGRTGRGLHANEFIPTTMVGPGLQQYPGSAANSLAAQTGETKYRPATFDGSASFDSYHPQGISTKQVPERIIGPYPRSDEERKHSSWLSRAAHKLTGDLGPIEHQNDDILRRRDEIRERAEEQVPMGQGGSGPPRIGVHKTSMYASDAPLNKASRAADNVTRKGVNNVDANQAAIDVTREGTRVNDSDESQGWFGNNYSADDRAGKIKQTADQSSGWFWNKKQEADDATSGVVDKVKRRASDAEYSAKEAADKTSGWFWNKKQDADEAVSDAANTVKRRASDAKYNAKEAASKTNGWFWNKTQDASDATSNAAKSVRQGASGAAQSASQG